MRPTTSRPHASTCFTTALRILTLLLVALVGAAGCTEEKSIVGPDAADTATTTDSSAETSLCGEGFRAPAPYFDCTSSGCPDGEVCDTSLCQPSSCWCDPATGNTECTDDCVGGMCVPAPACTEPNPGGCIMTGCEASYVCDTTQGCTSSSCTCDPESDTWGCTRDCGGGVCVPENPTACTTDADCTAGAEWCEEGVCVACDNSGLLCDIAACPPNRVMAERNGCFPCECQLVDACTQDTDCAAGTSCAAGPECTSWCEAGDPSCCHGNLCVPDTASTCTTDADCAEGAEWCENGFCVECDNSGLLCDMACPEGTDYEVRNGCTPCSCVAINECTVDAECGTGQRCWPGESCLSWCEAGDPACCYGNTCQ